MNSFIVIGLGKFGTAVAEELYSLGNEVLAVDTDADIVQRVIDNVTHAVVADAKEEGALKALGVRNFDCAIVCIGTHIEDSVLVTVLLKELGVNYVVAKAKSPLHIKVLQKIGADKVVFPENDMGQRLAQTLTSSNLIDYIELSEEYSIVEIKAPGEWIGKSLIELEVRAKYGINIIAIRGKTLNELTVSPPAKYIIKKDDTLITIGANEDINVFTSGDY